MNTTLVRRIAALVSLVFVSVVLSEARGSLLAYEGFDYPTGVLGGNSGGAGWGNAWNAGGISVASPGLAYPGLSVHGNAVTGGGAQGYRHLSAAAPNAPGTTLWASFLLSQVGPDFGNFGFYGNGDEKFSFGDTWTGSGVSPNYSIYVAGGLASGGSAYVDSGVPVSASGPQLLVAQMDIRADGTDVFVYLNPGVGGTAPSTGTAIASYNSSQVLALDEVRIEIRNGSIDELRIATSYSEAIGVPEPTSLALLAVAFGGLRRRR